MALDLVKQQTRQITSRKSDVAPISQLGEDPGPESGYGLQPHASVGPAIPAPEIKTVFISYN
jgi:hypothetical protein